MGVDARITFDSYDGNIDELAYDLACRVSGFFSSHPCIMPGTEWTDDDVEYIADYYEIATWSRYWGPGYERGDWPKIRMVLAFLLHRGVKGLCYDGDSEPRENHQSFHEGTLADYDAHFFGPHALDYQLGWNMYGDTNPSQPNDAYGRPMIRSGWGGTGTDGTPHSYESYYSPATGEHVSFRGGVKVAEEK